MKIRIQKQNNTDDFFKAIGISPKRKDQLFELVKKARKNKDTKSSTLQAIADGSQNIAEAMASSYIFGKQSGTEEKAHDVAHEIMGKMFSGATPNEVFLAVLDAVMTLFFMVASIANVVSIINGNANWLTWLSLVMQIFLIVFTLKRRRLI